MCCTFNALAAEKIYRESKFSQNVAALQKQNVLDSFECNYYYYICYALILLYVRSV